MCAMFQAIKVPTFKNSLETHRQGSSQPSLSTNSTETLEKDSLKKKLKTISSLGSIPKADQSKRNVASPKADDLRSMEDGEDADLSPTESVGGSLSPVRSVCGDQGNPRRKDLKTRDDIAAETKRSQKSPLFVAQKSPLSSVDKIPGKSHRISSEPQHHPQSTHVSPGSRKSTRPRKWDVAAPSKPQHNSRNAQISQGGLQVKSPQKWDTSLTVGPSRLLGRGVGASDHFKADLLFGANKEENFKPRKLDNRGIAEGIDVLNKYVSGTQSDAPGTGNPGAFRSMQQPPNVNRHKKPPTPPPRLSSAAPINKQIGLHMAFEDPRHRSMHSILLPPPPPLRRRSNNDIRTSYSPHNSPPRGHAFSSQRMRNLPQHLNAMSSLDNLHIPPFPRPHNPARLPFGLRDRSLPTQSIEREQNSRQPMSRFSPHRPGRRGNKRRRWHEENRT